MALHSNSATALRTDVRSDFSTKEGTYRNVKASEHCRPSRQPLFGKELSPVQVSCVSCKGKEGLCDWIVFNSGRELYFYSFQGVGKVSEWEILTRGWCFSILIPWYTKLLAVIHFILSHLWLYLLLQKLTCVMYHSLKWHISKPGKHNNSVGMFQIYSTSFQWKWFLR